MSKKKPPQRDWLKAERIAFVEELTLEIRGSARGTILVSSAMLDEVLRRLLFRSMVDPGAAAELLADSPSAPLGSFSARIQAARALGLISDRERRCLETLRGIRNIYAHKLSAEIDHESVDSQILSLCDFVDTLIGTEGGLSEPIDRTNPPKDIYATIAVILLTEFLLRMRRIPTDQTAAILNP